MRHPLAGLEWTLDFRTLDHFCRRTMQSGTAALQPECNRNSEPRQNGFFGVQMHYFVPNHCRYLDSQCSTNRSTASGHLPWACRWECPLAHHSCAPLEALDSHLCLACSNDQDMMGLLVNQCTVTKAKWEFNASAASAANAAMIAMTVGSVCKASQHDERWSLCTWVSLNNESGDNKKDVSAELVCNMHIVVYPTGMDFCASKTTKDTHLHIINKTHPINKKMVIMNNCTIA